MVQMVSMSFLFSGLNKFRANETCSPVRLPRCQSEKSLSRSTIFKSATTNPIFRLFVNRRFAGESMSITPPVAASSKSPAVNPDFACVRPGQTAECHIDHQPDVVSSAIINQVIPLHIIHICTRRIDRICQDHDIDCMLTPKLFKLLKVDLERFPFLTPHLKYRDSTLAR